MSVSDLRAALRVIAKSPGLSLIAIVTLAIGIGVNTAVFTVANALLLRPLPYADPDRLVLISSLQFNDSDNVFKISYPFFTSIRDRTHTLSGMSAATFENFNLTRHGDPEQVLAGRVNANFFDVLGVHPMRGRGFVADEDQPGGRNVVILSYEFATRLFGTPDAAVGKTLTLDASDHTVVGVLPRTFAFTMFGPRRDIWAPRPFDFSLVTPARVARGGPYFDVIARLREGVSRTEADDELAALYRQYAQDKPGNFDATLNQKVRALSLQDQLVAGVRPTLLILWASVAVVLLIACANVASLLLSRALGRRREFAVRVAMGATRWAVIRQLLTESLLIAVVSGSIGIVLASMGTRVLVALNPDNLKSAELSLDARVLLFTAAISLLSGVLFGLAPSLQMLRADLIGALRDEGRGFAGTRRGNRSRSLLVIVQVALSTVLLIASGLLLRSLLQLRNESLGFDAAKTLTMQITLPRNRATKPDDMIAFYRRTLEAVEHLPGVTAAAISTALPVTPNHLSPMLFEGQPAVALGKRPILNLQQVSPDYLKVMRIPLVAGRMFNEHDDATSPQVAIVNQLAVRRFWPNVDPLGRRIWLGALPKPYEVVGVIGDVKNNGPASAATPELFLSYPQMPVQFLSLSVRTETNPYNYVSTVRSAMLAVDRDQPLTEVKTMEDVVESLSAGRRFTMFLIGTLSVAAFFLSVVGIYGVIAYSVVQRTQEMGIRMALGAARGNILRLVIARGVGLTAVGLMIGALSRLLATLLYKTSTRDPEAYVASAVLFLAAALLACYWPARRATRVDPAECLRRE